MMATASPQTELCRWDCDLGHHLPTPQPELNIHTYKSLPRRKDISKPGQLKATLSAWLDTPRDTLEVVVIWVNRPFKHLTTFFWRGIHTQTWKCQDSSRLQQ